MKTLVHNDGFRMSSRLLLAVLPALSMGCVGTTGSGIVDFDAYASGPPGATHAFEFDLATGYHVTLTQATVQIGAVYLDARPCEGSSAPTTCGDPNVVTVAQVNGGTDVGAGLLQSGVLVDALSPDPQPFPAQGSGLVQEAASAQVWLNGGTTMMAIYGADPTTIAQVAGTATKDGVAYPFAGTVTINANRAMQGSSAEPGLDPLCLQRIAAPVCLATPVTPTPGTSLHMEVDPRHWVANIDFATLDTTSGPPYPIPDTNADPNGANLFQALESSTGVYSFSFENP